jgi:hypothetical protein
VLADAYVANRVELGNATTIFSAQGRTVSTAHAVVNSNMARGATLRGRNPGTRVEVALCGCGARGAWGEASLGPTELSSARQMFISVATAGWPSRQPTR